MFKYTKHSLKKLEMLFEEIEYAIRYEKGNFQSGYCIVEDRKIAVINKFFDTESRINALLEILGNIEVPKSKLSDKSLTLLREINKLTPNENEATEPSN